MDLSETGKSKSAFFPYELALLNAICYSAVILFHPVLGDLTMHEGNPDSEGGRN